MMKFLKMFTEKKPETHVSAKPYAAEGVALKRKFDRNTPEGEEASLTPEEAIPLNEVELTIQKKTLTENNSKLKILKSRAIKNQEILEHQLKTMRENKDILNQQRLIEKEAVERIKNFKVEILAKDELIKKDKHWIIENAEVIKVQKEEIKELAKKQSDLDNKIFEEKKTLQALDYELSGTRTALESMTAEAANKGKILNWQKGQIEEKLSTIAQLSESLIISRDDYQRISQVVSDNTERLALIDKELKEKDSEVKEVQVEWHTLNNILIEQQKKEELDQVQISSQRTEIANCQHDIMMMQADVDSLNIIKENNKETIQRLRLEEESLHLERNRLHIIHTQEKTSVDNQNQLLINLQNTIRAVSQEVTNFETSIVALADEHRQKESTVSNQRQELKELQFSIEESSNMHQVLQSEIAQMTEALNSQNKNLQEMNEVHSLKNKQVEDALKLKNALSTECDDVETQKSIVGHKLEELEAKKKKIETETRNLSFKMEAIGPDLEKIKGKCTELEAQMVPLLNEKTNLHILYVKNSEVVANQAMIYQEQEAKYSHLVSMINKAKLDLEEKEIELKNLTENSNKIAEQTRDAELVVAEQAQKVRIAENQLANSKSNYQTEFKALNQLKSKEQTLDLSLKDLFANDQHLISQIAEVNKNAMEIASKIEKMKFEEMILIEKTKKAVDEKDTILQGLAIVENERKKTSFLKEKLTLEFTEVSNELEIIRSKYNNVAQELEAHKKELSMLETSINKNHNELNKLSNEYVETQAKSSDLVLLIENKKMQEQVLNADLNSIRDRLSEISLKKELLERSHQAEEIRINSLVEKEEESKRTFNNYQEEILRLEFAINDYRSSIQEKSYENLEVQASLSELKLILDGKQLQRQTFENDADKVMKALYESNTKKEMLEKKIEEESTLYKTLVENEENYKSKLAENKKVIAMLESEIFNNHAKNQDLAQASDAFMAEIKELDYRLMDKKQASDSLKRKLNTLEASLVENKRKKELTLSQIDAENAVIIRLQNTIVNIENEWQVEKELFVKIDSTFNDSFHEKSSYVKRIEDLKAKKEVFTKSLQQKQLDFASKNQELSHLTKIEGQLKEDLRRMEETENFIDQEVSAFSELRKRLNDELVKINDFCAEKNNLITQKENEVEELRKNLQIVKREIQNKGVDSRSIKLDIETLHQNFKNLGSDLEKQLQAFDVEERVKSVEQINVTTANDLIKRLDKTFHYVKNSNHNTGIHFQYGMGQLGGVSAQYAPPLEKICSEFTHEIMGMQNRNVQFYVTIKQDQELLVAAIEVRDVVMGKKDFISGLNSKCNTLQQTYKAERMSIKVVDKLKTESVYSSVKLILSFVLDKDKSSSTNRSLVMKDRGVTQ